MGAVSGLAAATMNIADATNWLDHWQTLFAGVLGVGGGVIAYIGAMRAAKRQVDGATVAADRQVAAMKAQLDEARDARRESDERRRSVIKWAVQAEARRLEAAVWALEPPPRGNGALPSAGPRYASRRTEQLLIASSPLLRGEWEELVLLGDETRALLEEVGAALDGYNSRIKTASQKTDAGPLITTETLAMIQDLSKLVRRLRVADLAS
jgi:hypothetical protein